MSDNADLTPALADLQDAFARVLAHVHVLRLAMGGVRNESDIRALLSQLGTIEEELTHSEDLIRRQGVLPIEVVPPARLERATPRSTI